MKKNNKKGFTLAELLVVVAIIAILVAVAIPTFSAAQEKAYKGVAQANARSAYGELMIGYISGDTEIKEKQTITYDTGNKTTVCTVTKVDKDGKGNITNVEITASIDGKDYGTYEFSPKSTQNKVDPTPGG